MTEFRPRSSQLSHLRKKMPELPLIGYPRVTLRTGSPEHSHWLVGSARWAGPVCRRSAQDEAVKGNQQDAEKGQLGGRRRHPVSPPRPRWPGSFYRDHKPQGSPRFGRLTGGSVLDMAGLGCPWDIARRQPAGSWLSRAGQGAQAMNLRILGVQGVTEAMGW